MIGKWLCQVGLHKWKHEVQSLRYAHWAPSWVDEDVLDFVYFVGWEVPTGRKRCVRCAKEVE